MRFGLIAALVLSLAASATSQPPPHHNPGIESPLFEVHSRDELQARADAGMTIERDRSAAAELEEHRKLDRALHALLPQRPGVVDAYVISIALDSDAVFAREARVAGDVLRRRYDAAGRSIVLAGSDGAGLDSLPRGTPATLAIALARIAELMNRREDVLVLYTTSHGAPFGLYYNDGDNGYGAISPNRLGGMLDQLGIANRLVILSACYSGVFVPVLQSDASAIVTAASADRTSFGCRAENDWTFFGDAMINHALRKPQPLAAAFAEASNLVAGWEAQSNMLPSQPQVFIGATAARWLAPLERRTPLAATQPVGHPAFDPAALPGLPAAPGK
jgi:hypothetical protein